MSETKPTPTNAPSAAHEGYPDVPLSEGEVLLLKHEPAVQVVSLNAFRPNETSGEVDGVHWSTSEKLGKQQPVLMADLAFPEGTTLPVVFRPTRSKFKQFYEEYPTVRQFYPKLYTSAQVVEEDSKWPPLPVLTMEKIEGIHFGDKAKDYWALVSTPEGLEQLSQDIFTAADEILAEPVMIDDVDPATGHNVIYNTKTNRFQFFDVDTLRPSDDPHVQKFLKWFLSPISMGEPRHETRDAQLAFITRMIQLYEQAHPNTSLSYESDPKEKAEYSETDEVYPASGTLLYVGTEEYEKAYRQVAGRGFDSMTLGRNADYPVFKKIVKKGKDVTKIDPDMLDAIHEGDVVRLESLFKAKQSGASRGRLTTTQFVEAAA